MTRALQRAAKRTEIARAALEANRPDSPPVLLSLVEDAIEGAKRLEDGYAQELGSAPSARERREHGV